MWQAPVTHLTPCYTEPPCPANSPPRAFPWDDAFQRCTPHFECKNCKLWCQLLKQEGNKETDMILLVHKLWLPNRSSLLLHPGYILPLGTGHSHPLDSWPDASKYEKQRHPISLRFSQQHVGTENGEDSGSDRACERGNETAGITTDWILFRGCFRV